MIESTNGHFVVENVRGQVRPVPLDFAFNLLKRRPEPLLLRQMKQPSRSMRLDMGALIVVGPREMMGGPVHQHRSLRFLVDHVDEGKAPLLVKTPSIGREAAGKNQQAARHQQLLKLGPGEQAVAALNALVLGAVSHDVDQTCSAPEGADEAGFGVVGCQLQRRPAFVEQAVHIGFVVHQVSKGRQILRVCAWVSMADKHGGIVGEGPCLARAFQPAVLWRAVVAILVLAELEDVGRPQVGCHALAGK